MNRELTQKGLLPAMQQVVIDVLPNGYPSIASTAARIGISVRTMQRRLAESGVNYSEFVAQVRFEQACRDLKNPRIPLGKVSVRLGYRDPSSFSRAFARWAGMAPRQYRQQAAGSRESTAETRHRYHD
ncbi:MAG: helix-turn-helix transcriptional regulator [Gammaproteobacteria bacterium]